MTHEDTKKTVRAAVAWLQGTAASVAEDAPKDVLMQLTAARRELDPRRRERVLQALG